LKHVNCIEFKKEKAGALLPPQQITQGYIIEDEGGWTLPPPAGGTQFSKTAGMSIIPNLTASGNLQNHLFIAQGKLKIQPTEEKLKQIDEKLRARAKVTCYKVAVVAKHFFGPPGQPIVTAYSKGKEVASAQGSAAQGISQTLLVIAEDINYIIIHGCEVKIEKICFFYA
jgi:hypothetical protein